MLEEELRLLRHKIFERRSERVSAEDLRQNNLKKHSEPTVEVSAHGTAKHGRRLLPTDLPHDEVVHVRGFLCIKRAIPAMRKSGGGRT